MATTTCVLPKHLSPPFLSNSTSFSTLHPNKNNNLPFSITHSADQIHPHCTKKPKPKPPHAKKKNPWLDPFDDGEDPTMDFGSHYADGKQDEDPRPPDNPNSPSGYLKFPPGYAVEVASLPLKIRGDVRRCCCVISGGVYENLLFFPAIQLIKDRYPGVQIDVVTSSRGKQCYELNKNVRWAEFFDIEDQFPDPAEYTDMVGILKNRYYDMVLSTKLAGIGHAAFLFMTTARDRVSYIYPNVNAAGAGLFLSETFTPNSTNLSDGGYNMYKDMVEWLGKPGRKVPRHYVAPLKVSLSRKLKEYVEAKYKKLGVEKGKYIVIHGLKADSKATMQSRGDIDSLLPIEIWSMIAKEIREFTPVFVIPHENVREDVEEIIGENAKIMFITTPGQLAALINDSAGVISTNTAAILLAHAREKACIALFGSEEKAKIFVPNQEENKFTIVSSQTGKLIDIDVQAVKDAIKVFNVSSVAPVLV
ncbi:hypothetical protein V2J09_005363 [Rumex salicifolius]